MPRRALILVCLVAVAGCQRTTPAPVESRVTTLSAENDYDAVTASALVFDPPVVQGEPRLELSRAAREPRVAVGFEGPTVERFYIRMDDRQINDGLGNTGSRGGSGIYDRYERRAVTERTGVRYR